MTETPQPQFVHVVCWLCHGRRYVAADTFTAEHDERCAVCAGKGTIVTEREENAC